MDISRTPPRFHLSTLVLFVSAVGLLLGINIRTYQIDPRLLQFVAPNGSPITGHFEEDGNPEWPDGTKMSDNYYYGRGWPIEYIQYYSFDHRDVRVWVWSGIVIDFIVGAILLVGVVWLAAKIIDFVARFFKHPSKLEGKEVKQK